MAFDNSERAILLIAPGLGPIVVHRLEEIGVDSFAKLKAIGADAAVRLICDRLGTVAWSNRRRHLKRLCTSLESSG